MIMNMPMFKLEELSTPIAEADMKKIQKAMQWCYDEGVKEGKRIANRDEKIRENIVSLNGD